MGMDSAMNNTSSMENIKECQQVKWNIHSFITYYMPFIIVMGLIGNVLSALTFMCTKLRSLPSSYYLTALAMADCGMLLCHLMLMTGGVYTLGALPGVCQMTMYAGGVFSFQSVWYVVCFTLERYIAVRYPLRRLKLCTVRRARYMVISVAAFACVFNSHILISSTSIMDEMNRTVCSVHQAFLEVANTMNHVDTVLTLVIPLVLIIAWNGAIVTTLCVKAKRDLTNLIASRRRGGSNMSGPPTVEEGVITGLLLPACVSETPFGGELRFHVRRKLADDRRMTCMLLIVSLVFIIMNFPDHLVRMVIYGLYRTGKWETLNISKHCWITTVQQVTMILFNTNFAINFFLYSLVGANFRAHLKTLFPCFKPRPAHVDSRISYQWRSLNE